MDTACNLNSTEEVSQGFRPGHTGEFEHHPCQGQSHEAQDDKDVGDSLTLGEALDIVSFMHSLVLLLFFQMLEGTGHPQKGVQSKKAEYRNEKNRHCPECEMEDGVFLPVMVGGMREVPGEATVGIRMAFLTGAHNLVETDMGVRIIDLFDVVCAVTIRTFC